MMRKLLILAATTAALASAPALAATSGDEVDGTVNITGEVTGRCKFTTESVTLPLGELSRSDNGELDTSRVNTKSANLAGWCNAAASEISVHAAPIDGPTFTGDTNAFTSRINYKATAAAGQVSANDTSSSEGAGTPSTLGLYSGTISVTLSEAGAGGKKLVAGDYTGTVTVTLTPKFAAPAVIELGNDA